MPHHKSAIKRMHTSRRARVRNMAVRSRLRTAVKRVRTADTAATAQEALAAAVVIIDKTARKGVIHKNQAARRKSRLTRMVNAME